MPQTYIHVFPLRKKEKKKKKKLIYTCIFQFQDIAQTSSSKKSTPHC